MLATVISSSGSAPAAILSKMIVKKGGSVSVGTIGGGCMEGEVVLSCARLYESGRAEILSYSLDEDWNEAGLICGGSVEILLEPIARERAAMIEEIKITRDSGEDCILATCLSPNGTIYLKTLIKPGLTGFLHVAEMLSRDAGISPGEIVLALEKTESAQETLRLKSPSGELLIEIVKGLPCLIIFGGGHVSKYISQAASMAGFRVTVVDDRDKYANPSRFPEAELTLAGDYGEVFGKLKFNSSTYIVIVTRGHRFDEHVLEQAVKIPVKYIGMIGSKRKVLTAFRHLREKGISEELLGRVHAPIGIDFGAVTAEEIAVSIVAQLIHIRRAPGRVLRYMSEGMADLAARSEGSNQAD